MGRWSRRLAPLFVAFAGVQDGDRVLDVGCGTGSLAEAVAAVTRRSEIVGIDPSAPFIEYASSRMRNSRITFEVGSALAIPYSDTSFDRCLSLLVLHQVPNVPKALSEMRRVVREGGMVAACAWDRAGMELHRAFWEAASELDPSAERHREARGYDSDRPSALWREGGLREVEETTLVIPLEFSSFDDFWEPFMGEQGATGSYLNSLPPGHQIALRERLRERLLGNRLDGPFALHARAWAVRGIR